MCLKGNSATMAISWNRFDSLSLAQEVMQNHPQRLHVVLPTNSTSFQSFTPKCFTKKQKTPMCTTFLNFCVYVLCQHFQHCFLPCKTCTVSRLLWHPLALMARARPRIRELRELTALVWSLASKMQKEAGTKRIHISVNIEQLSTTIQLKNRWHNRHN